MSRNIKSGISKDEGRLKREKVSLSLRKEKRHEHLAKRRDESLADLSTDALTTQLQRLPEFVQKVFSDDLQQQIEGTHGLRKLLSLEQPEPLTATIQANVIPRLVEFLRVPENNLQFEAAWALTNIASGSSEHTMAVVNAHAVPALIRTIGQPGKLNVKEQCIWALGNIAGEGHDARNYILNSGAMGVVVQTVEQAIHEGNKSILKNIVWALANLCRAKPLPEPHLIQPAIPLLVRLLSNPDHHVVGDAVWAFVYLSDSDNAEDIERVIQCGAVPKLLDLLTIDDAKVQTPALRALGNILTGNDRQSDFVIDQGLLPRIKHIVVNGRPAVQREAIWALSNVTAGSAHQITLCFSNGLMHPVIKLLTNASFEVRKEALWCVANAIVSGTFEHCQQIINDGAHIPIIQLMSVADTDCVSVALDAVLGLLKTGEKMANATGEVNPFKELIISFGGLEKIGDLQRHPDDKIYRKTTHVLETYFMEHVSEEQEDVVPEVVGETYQFQAGGFNL
ncbi:hypothetical protein P9112_005072 [Eukaryota sp. TZLM1-RC]